MAISVGMLSCGFRGAAVALGVLASGRPCGAALALAQRHLALDVTLDYPSRSLSGTARLTLENVSAAAVSTVPLNLNRLMRVAAARDATGRALGFRQEVTVFADDPFLQVDHVSVALGEPLRPGGRVGVELAYSGPLVGYVETGSLYIRDRIDEAFTILRRDAYAFPVVEETSWEENRAAPPDEFSFEARVSVPEFLSVATGGRLVARSVSDGRATFDYASDAPVPFLNIAIARFEVVERGGIRVHHFPEDAGGARRLAEQAERALGRLAQWFGPLAREPRVTVIEIPEGWGSQADLVAGIIQTASAFREPEALQELYHELSHLWNAPDTDSPSARWNEGLGRYLQQRLAEDLDGWSGMSAEIERVAAGLVERARSDAVLREQPLARFGAVRATDHSYRLGYLVFCGLERLMGREALQRGLRAYYQDHKLSGGTLLQLESALQAAASRDLSGFFRDWVHSTTWLGLLAAEGSLSEALAGGP
jgi:aminopeptidase N